MAAASCEVMYLCVAPLCLKMQESVCTWPLQWACTAGPEQVFCTFDVCEVSALVAPLLQSLTGRPCGGLCNFLPPHHHVFMQGITRAHCRLVKHRKPIQLAWQSTRGSLRTYCLQHHRFAGIERVRPSDNLQSSQLLPTSYGDDIPKSTTSHACSILRQ